MLLWVVHNGVKEKSITDRRTCAVGIMPLCLLTERSLRRQEVILTVKILIILNQFLNSLVYCKCQTALMIWDMVM